jgi:hypothetical protein
MFEHGLLVAVLLVGGFGQPGDVLTKRLVFEQLVVLCQAAQQGVVDRPISGDDLCARVAWTFRANLIRQVVAEVGEQEDEELSRLRGNLRRGPSGRSVCRRHLPAGMAA